MRYIKLAMNPKPITFRCSARQLQRIKTAQQTNGAETRSALISEALFHFLNFVERKDIAKLNLFQLVTQIDNRGNGPRFSEQA